MIPPVIIQFQARGVPDISAAMRSVADVVTRVERGATAATTAGSRQRSRVVDEEARNRAAAAKRGEAEFGAALRKSAREAEQTARTSAAERIRIARQLATEELRLRGEVARSFGKPMSPTTGAKARLAIVQAAKNAPQHEQAAAIQQVKNLRVADTGTKAEERAALQTARAKIAAMKVADREVAKGQAQGLRDHERAEAEKNRSSMKWVREREREIRREHLETERRRGAVGRAIVGAGADAGRTLYRGGVGLARAAVNMGGGFDVQDTLHEKLSLERQAALLSNTTSQGEGTRVDKSRILETVRGASVRTGTDESALMSGLSAYVDKTGSYKEGAENIDFYSKVAKSTGASIEDVMRTAGTMAVQNKDISAGELRQLTLSTVMQSRKGSVGYEQMAKVGGKITRSASGYVGEQAQLQSELLGLTQIGMRTEGNDPAAAATDISNIQGDALKHRGKVNALLGHDAFNEKGQIKGGPSKFIADMLEASGGDMSKLIGAGMGKPAVKMFQALAPTFNKEQEKALKAGKSQKEANAAGKAAVLADIKDVSAGKYDEKDLEKDFSTVMATSAEQFEGSVRLLKQEVGDKLVPALIPLVQVIRDATPQIGRFLTAFVSLVAWAERNPLAAAVVGMGAMLTKAVVAEVASAKIGELIKSLLSGGGAPGGKLGGVGKGLAVVGAGLVAGELTKEWVDEGFAAEDKKAEGRRSRMLEANELAGRAMRGGLTPEQQKRAKELAGVMKKDIERMGEETDPANHSVVEKVTGAFGAVVGGKDFEKAQRMKVQEGDRAIKMQTETMNKLIASLDKNTAATDGNTKAPAAAPAPPPGGTNANGGGDVGGMSIDPSSDRLIRPLAKRPRGATPQ